MMDAMMPVIHLIVIAAIAFQIQRRQQHYRILFWPSLAFKLLAGVCMGLLYTHYYSSADTFAYLGDAMAVGELAKNDLPAYFAFLFGSGEDPGVELLMTEPRALFYTRVVSIFSLLTNGNYWAAGFYFSFLSFLASWWLVQVICRNIPSASLAAVFAFLLLPSVVFWTSGVLKESLAVASLFFLTFLFLKAWFHENVNWWEVAAGVLSLWILWQLKYYYAGVFVPVAVTSLLSRLLKNRFRLSGRAQLLVGIGIFAFAVLAVTVFHPNFRAGRLLEVVVENNRVYSEISSSDNIVEFHDLKPSMGSFLLNAPWALISGLFRPFTWEVSSVLHLCAAIENSVLLILFMISLTRRAWFSNASLRLLVVAAVVYIVVLAVFLTLSAPNLGTLSRYRVGYLSFFVLLISCDNPLFRHVERLLNPFVNDVLER